MKHYKHQVNLYINNLGQGAHAVVKVARKKET